MGSVDDWHEKHPEANRALEEDGSFVPAKPSATSSEGRRVARQRTALSAPVQLLARGLGVTSEELARRIPEDTLRRTKYPVKRRVQPDGTTLFEHDPGIIEGPRALIHR